MEYCTVRYTVRSGLNSVIQALYKEIMSKLRLNKGKNKSSGRSCHFQIVREMPNSKNGLQNALSKYFKFLQANSNHRLLCVVMFESLKADEHGITLNFSYVK